MSTQKFDVKYTQIFINGEFVNSVSGKTFETLNPSTGKHLAHIQEGDKEDIDRAVKAARDAFPKWSTIDANKRATILQKFADLIEQNIDELAYIESLDNGKPYTMAKHVDLMFCIDNLRYFAGWCDKIHGKTIPTPGEFFSYTAHEPIGVIGCIIPWNFPALMFMWKVAPALACGNTMVIKPAETSPLTALYLAKLAVEAGVHPGALNVVPGYGPTAGQALARHMDSITSVSLDPPEPVDWYKSLQVRAT
jgi:acyl-CoA reductase-like NAD-dependent aldehyde dehydrogenase